MMRKLMPDSCSIETWPEEEAAVPRHHPDQAQAAAAVVAAAGAHHPLGLLPALADLLLQLAAQANHQQAAQAAVQVQLQVQVGPDHPIRPEKSKLRLTTTATTEDMRAATKFTMKGLAEALVAVCQQCNC